MKKTLTIVISFILAFSLVACSDDDSALVFEDGLADLELVADSYEELEKYSDLIVEVEVVGEKVNKSVIEEKGIVHYGVTKTFVEIVDIFKSNEVKIGDKVAVWEDYFLTTNDKGKEYYITIEGYRPMREGEKYLLFLVKNDKGTFSSAYSISGAYQGKFPMELINQDNNKKISEESLEIGANQEKFEKLLIDVRDKYKEKKKSNKMR